MFRRAGEAAGTQHPAFRAERGRERARRENPPRPPRPRFLHDFGSQSRLVPALNQARESISENQALRVDHADRKESNVRAVELVGGTSEEIAIPILHVDQFMWRVMNGIDENFRTDGMRHFAGAFYIVNCAKSVRCRPDAQPVWSVGLIVGKNRPNPVRQFPDHFRHAHYQAALFLQRRHGAILA